MILTMEAVTVAAVLLIALVPSFWTVLALIVLWGLSGAALTPVRQAYLNGMIPSRQRATILSFDSLMGSAGGVVAQPALGRSADVWGYPVSFALSAAVSALSLPFIWLARREQAPADTAVSEAPAPATPA
jgi:MFS family permease